MSCDICECGCCDTCNNTVGNCSCCPECGESDCSSCSVCETWSCVGCDCCSICECIECECDGEGIEEDSDSVTTAVKTFHCPNCDLDRTAATTAHNNCCYFCLTPLVEVTDGES
jgi:hypothetical protein